GKTAFLIPPPLFFSPRGKNHVPFPPPLYPPPRKKGGKKKKNKGGRTGGERKKKKDREGGDKFSFNCEPRGFGFTVVGVASHPP
ncbi:hypothetical protein ACNIST_25760, partial [Escherichia coli]